MKPRYYVHEAHGFRIDPSAGYRNKRGSAQDARIPTCFYVFDREDNHRAVRAFPSHERWAGAGPMLVSYRRQAEAFCVRLNAEDAEEAAA